jgi:Tfp pilus assembly protein PilV
MTYRYYTYRGQSLVEAVVTLGVVVLLVTGLIVGTTSSLRYAENSRTRNLATQYAQEGLELARQKRDDGWSTFIKLSGMRCVKIDDQGVTVIADIGTCPETDGRFTRTISFTPDSQVEKEITQMIVVSSVSWSASAIPIALQTTLTNWK